jgi:hypothetical protein
MIPDLIILHTLHIIMRLFYFISVNIYIIKKFRIQVVDLKDVFDRCVVPLYGTVKRFLLVFDFLRKCFCNLGRI